MKICLAALFAVSLAPFVAAQEADMSPAPELQQLAPMIGDWEGEGVLASGGGQSGSWRARSSARWVLGGHFIREDTSIDQDGMPVPLEITNVMGWDRNNQRFVSIEVSNMGQLRVKTLHIEGGSRIVSAGTFELMGQLITERSAWELSDSETNLAIHQAHGSGDFFEAVRGSMKRVDRRDRPVELSNQPLLGMVVAPAAKEIKKIAGICGEYRMTGWMVPAPGAPKMELSGSERVRAICGGSVLEFFSEGEPMAAMGDFTFEGLGWIGWDPAARCYKMAFANNVGEMSMQECRYVDGKMIFSYAGVYQGQPVCNRGVVTLTDDGGFETFAQHTMTGDLPPFESFGATYERLK